MKPDRNPSGSGRPSPDNGELLAAQHPITRVFLGPKGFRVGWRLVFAVALWFVISGLLPLLLIWIPGARALLASVRSPRFITPSLLLLADGITASAALLAAAVMSRIESRSFAEYGFPAKAAFGKRFWQGCVCGFAMISLLMGLTAALHGFSISGVDLHGFLVARYAFLYFAGFIVVAVFEEFSFRGYLQSTLQLATGFWPAAVIWAVAFGAIHVANPGESVFGLIMVGCFGLFAAFTLRRTGSVWFAIGLHAAWDWGETFFYSVRDSGVPATGHLLNSQFRGPVWLTGGDVGPEGSLIVFAVLVLSAVALHFLFPAAKQSP
jgi:CAAX protease family protein